MYRDHGPVVYVQRILFRLPERRKLDVRKIGKRLCLERETRAVR
jgi:hypothetical protein